MSYFGMALVELTLLGLLSGLVGVLIVLRKRSFFAVALSHATFPGGVAAAIIGANVLLGQAVFAVLLVLIMALLGRVPGQGRQVASGVVLSFGFALGTLLSSMNRGLGVPVEALLVGSPFGVSSTDVWATAAVLAATALLLAIFGRRILFDTFDPVGSRAAGYRAWPIELLVSGLVAAGVVVAMPAVGAILGVSILIGPAAAARVLVRDIRWLPPLAAALGVLSGVGGLWVSRTWDVAAGGAVGLVVALVFLLALAIRGLARYGGARRKESTT